METQTMQKPVNVHARLMAALACDSRTGRKLLVKSALFTNPLAEECQIVKALMPKTHKLLGNFSEMSMAPDLVFQRAGGMAVVRPPGSRVQMSILEQGPDGRWISCSVDSEAVPVFSKRGITDIALLHLSEMEKTLSGEISLQPRLLKFSKCAKWSATKALAGASVAGTVMYKLSGMELVIQGAPALLACGIAGVASLYAIGSVRRFLNETRVRRTLRDFESFVHELKAGAGKFLLGKSHRDFYDCF